MASDRQQFTRAETHYRRLREEGQCSLAPDIGIMVAVTMFDDSSEVLRKTDSPDQINEEAKRIVRYQKRLGKAACWKLGATVEDLWDVLDDRRVSDITLIGRGMLSAISVDSWARESSPDKRKSFFNWFDAISHDGKWPSSTHLKLGSFYQRTSGVMPIDTINPPVGWGLMLDRTRILAATGRGFSPSRRHTLPQEGLTVVAESLGLTQQELQGPISYELAKEIFRKYDPIWDRRYNVPGISNPMYDRLRDNQLVRVTHDRVRELLKDKGILKYQ